MTNPSSYADVRSHTFWHAYGYLYFLLVTISYVIFGSMLLTFWLFLPRLTDAVEEGMQQAPSWYPPELVLTFSTGGELTTNVQEPYVVTSLDPILSFQRQEPVSRMFSHMLTIDTSANIEDFYDYDSHILFTKYAFAGHDKNEGLRSFFYRQFMQDATEPLIVDYALYLVVLERVSPYVAWIPWIAGIGGTLSLLVVPWITAFFWSLWLLFFLALLTLGSWVFSALQKRTLSYGRLYVYGMYVLTLPLIVTPIIDLLLGVEIAFLFTILFFVMMWMVLGNANAKKKRVAVKSSRKSVKKK